MRVDFRWLCFFKQYAQPGTAFRQHRVKPSCRAFLCANGNRCDFLATHQRRSSASGRWPSRRRAFRNIGSKRNPTCGLRVGLIRSYYIWLFYRFESLVADLSSSFRLHIQVVYACQTLVEVACCAFVPTLWFDHHGCNGSTTYHSWNRSWFMIYMPAQSGTRMAHPRFGSQDSQAIELLVALLAIITHAQAPPHLHTIINLLGSSVERKPQNFVSHLQRAHRTCKPC